MNASVLKGAAILIFAGAMSVMTGCGGNQQQAPGRRSRLRNYGSDTHHLRA